MYVLRKWLQCNLSEVSYSSKAPWRAPLPSSCSPRATGEACLRPQREIGSDPTGLKKGLPGGVERKCYRWVEEGGVDRGVEGAWGGNHLTRGSVCGAEILKAR